MGASQTRLASTGDAEEKRMVSDGGARDASETVIGKRERAPAEGAANSDVPIHSQERDAAWETPDWPLFRVRR